MKGLLIKSPHIDNILRRRNTWEIRGTNTKELNSTIALIKSGSGMVVGKCKIAAVRGPLNRDEMERNETRHLVETSRIDEVLKRYKTYYAWELSHVVRLTSPVRYEHPSGAVIWVTLAPSVAAQVAQG